MFPCLAAYEDLDRYLTQTSTVSVVRCFWANLNGGSPFSRGCGRWSLWWSCCWVPNACILLRLRNTANVMHFAIRYAVSTTSSSFSWSICSCSSSVALRIASTLQPYRIQTREDSYRRCTERRVVEIAASHLRWNGRLLCYEHRPS